MHMDYLCTVPVEAKETIRFPGIPWGWWCITVWVLGSNPEPPQEQTVLLIVEPSFQTHEYYFFFWGHGVYVYIKAHCTVS